MAAAGRAPPGTPPTAEREARVAKAGRGSLDRMEAITAGSGSEGFRVCTRRWSLEPLIYIERRVS